MLKLRKLQEQKKKELEASGKSPANNTNSNVSPAMSRVLRDLEDLKTPKGVTLTFPNKEDKMNFTVTVVPQDGYYKGGKIDFSVSVSENYPMEAPKVKCIPKIFHPNIDLEGNVCLNILREEWTAAMDLYQVIVGLLVLFAEPNPLDPLNKIAANLLAKEPKRFAYYVVHTMSGLSFNGESYDEILPPRYR